MPLSDYDQIISDAADEWNLDPRFLRAILMQENGRGDRYAISRSGALGIGQLMPATARALGVTDPFDPVQSIYGAAKYLDAGLSTEGSPERAALYYHGGPGWRGNFGPESAAYVPGVVRNFKLASAGGSFPVPKGATSDEDDPWKLLPPAPEPSAPSAAAPQGKRGETAPTAAPAASDDPWMLLPPAPEPAKTAPPTVPLDRPLGMDVGRLSEETGLPLPQPTAPPTTPITPYSDFRTALQPDPNTEYGALPWDWLATDKTTGTPRVAMPSSIRQGLINLFDDTPASEGGGLVTYSMDPTGRITPGLSAGTNLLLTAATPFLAPDLRFGAMDPWSARPAMPDITQGPSGVSPVAPAVSAAAAARPAGTRTPLPPNYVTPPARMPGALPDITTADLMTGSAADRAAAAKTLVDQAYSSVRSSTSTLTSDFGNTAVDGAISKLARPPNVEEAARALGNDPLVPVRNLLSTLKDKALSVQDIMGIDQLLGDQITKEYGPGGLSSNGRMIQEAQKALREAVDKASPGDVTGGSAGFDDLNRARQTFTQYKKFDDIARIEQRAAGTTQPEQSFKTQMNTLLNNAKKSRGYSDEERAALQDSLDRGVLGNALNIFGSRLISGIAGSVAGGAGGGMLGSLVGLGVAEAGSAAARNWAVALQKGRMANALDVIAGRVPAPGSPEMPMVPTVPNAFVPPTPAPPAISRLSPNLLQPPPLPPGFI